MFFKIARFPRALASVAWSLALLPAMAVAQNRPQAGGGGGGGIGVAGMGAGPAAQVQQVLKNLDLTEDQKTQVQGIVRKAQQDLRDAMGDMQNATPQERQQSIQDLQKIISATKEKVAGVLTADQRAKFYPLSAKAAVSQATDRVKLIQSASGKLEIADDEKTQLKTVFDDDLKSLDGFKTDADAVTDAATDTEVEDKVTKLMTDTRRQLMQIMGQDDLQQLLQSVRQAQGGRAARANAGIALPKATPATQPAAK